MFSNLGKQYFLPGQYFVSVVDAIGGTDLAYHLVSAVDPFADGQQSIPGLDGVLDRHVGGGRRRFILRLTAGGIGILIRRFAVGLRPCRPVVLSCFPVSFSIPISPEF